MWNDRSNDCSFGHLFSSSNLVCLLGYVQLVAKLAAATCSKICDAHISYGGLTGNCRSIRTMTAPVYRYLTYGFILGWHIRLAAMSDIAPITGNM